jgi:hypothetical protein
VSRANDLKLGDPQGPGTQLGSLVSRKQLERVEEYVRIGLDEEATLAAGGHRNEAWAAPTVSRSSSIWASSGSTTITVQTRDFACTVVSDCVDTCVRPGFQDAALGIVERAFGWVMGADEVLDAVGGARRERLADRGRTYSRVQGG